MIPPRDAPPFIPEEPEALERAIMLLGNRAQALRLRRKARVELEQLVGAYPSPTQAAAWKHALTRVRKESAL